MTRFLFIVFIALFLLSSGPQGAQAQACVTDYELIFKMEDPEIGSYNVWDTVYGEQDKQERFVTGLVLENRNTLVVGERFVYEGGDVDLLLAEIDRRGRTVWEKEHKIAGLSDIRRVLKNGAGYVVLGNYTPQKANRQVWLGVFDAKGELLSQKKISHPEGPLMAGDIVADHSGKGFLLAAARKNGEENTYNAILYGLSPKGNVLWDRAYMPGLDNQILGLSLDQDNKYIATGYIRGDDGRKNGWVVQVNSDGGIAWQRQYPRGRSAQLNIGRDFVGGYKIVGGLAYPSISGDPTGAWVMMVEGANGNVVWQRYYTGDLGYETRDIMVSKDGLFTVMAGGKKIKDEDAEYVRLLTVNSRGILYISDEYFNSEGAQGYQLLEGPAGERIIIGSTDMAFQIEKEGEEPQKGQSKDGWIVAAPSMEIYKDPCVQPYSFLP